MAPLFESLPRRSAPQPGDVPEHEWREALSSREEGYGVRGGKRRRWRLALRQTGCDLWMEMCARLEPLYGYFRRNDKQSCVRRQYEQIPSRLLEAVMSVIYRAVET